jgi:hypothetical protein
MKTHEELVDLLNSDEEAFNTYIREEIDKMIEGSPEHLQPRLRAMQFNIDMTLRRYKNPIARMNKMIEIFWQGFFKFKDAIDGKIPLIHEENNVKPFVKSDKK